MDFDNSFLDSVLEGAEEAIDMTLDAVQEQDTEIEETITTDVDDVEIDSIIGDDGKGSSALISDDDIEKIDSGKDPDFDTVDADAAKGAKDKEINDLEKDIEDGSIITKNEIKQLKEGQELLDFVGSVVSEDFELPSTGEEDIGEHECGVCHCTPCICKERVDMITHPSEENQQPRLISNKVPTDGVIFSDDNEYDDHTEDKPTFSMNQPSTVKEDDLFDNTNQDLTGVESDDKIHGNDTHELFSDDDDDDDDLEDHDDDNDDDMDLDDDDEIPTTPVTPKYNPEDDNEPAGPVQPLTDCKENNQYGFRFENNNEEGDLNMFEDEELLDESFEDEDLEIEDIANESAEEHEEEYTFSLDEQAEDCDDDTQFALEDASDDKAEDIIGEMDGLEDVDMFNSFEGSGINTKQYGEDDFLTGMNKNIDEPSGSFTSQDSLKFSQVDTRPFGKADDPSIADMIK